MSKHNVLIRVDNGLTFLWQENSRLHIQTLFNLHFTDTHTGLISVFLALCSPVGYQRCSSRGFTQTSYPNLMYHFTEEEAATAMEEAAKPVLNQLCQEAALHYLCSLYFPKCNATTGFQLFPCQSLCNGRYIAWLV